MAFVTVIYNQPKSAAAFEKYYWATHVPLVGANQAEVGFVGAELTKFDATLDGKKPTYYRQAVLWFNSMADLEKGIATPGFKAIGDDLGQVRDGGLIAMVGEQTNDATPLLSGDTTAFVTVIYKNPKDASGLRGLLRRNPPARWSGRVPPRSPSPGPSSTSSRKNLDGSPATLYRQAKLYFPNAAALKTGTATARFKAVGDGPAQVRRRRAGGAGGAFDDEVAGRGEKAKRREGERYSTFCSRLLASSPSLCLLRCTSSSSPPPPAGTSTSWFAP